MPDLLVSASVSRARLSLDALDINDHQTYWLADTVLGGQVTWNRTQVTSPFTDGAVTTFRSRQMVTETIGVEVRASSQPALHAAIDTLVQAFIQDSFTLTLALGTSAEPWMYACEAADYRLAWTGPRFIAKQAQVLFDVPRQPVALNGVT